MNASHLGHSDSDPFTTDARLCDDDGIVRKGLMWHGTDYPCTGHAHFAGEHYRCSSPAHEGNLPGPLLDVLMDRSIELPGDAEVKLLVDRRHLLSVMTERDRLLPIVRHIAGLVVQDDDGYSKVPKALIEAAREALDA